MTPDEFFSQYSEDRILNDIFDGKKDGVCVEVGGFDGVTGSTSYFFERLGWKCLLIEPIPALCEIIRRNRTCGLAETAASDKEGSATLYVAEGAETLSTVNASDYFRDRVKQVGRGIHEITVRTRRLDDILQEHGITRIDFISIDVEGHEMSALSGFSLERFRPRLVLLENNLNAADRKIKPYLDRHGYARFKRTGCNDWYARREDGELFNSADVRRTDVRVMCLTASESFWKLRETLKTLLPTSIVDRLRWLRKRMRSGV